MAVLRAAVRMFNARGFHATSLDDVAASLGVSKPTIYHYLGNKEQVLIECLTMGMEQLLAAAEQARQELGTGLERLRTFLRRYAEVNMDDFGRCTILTSNETLSARGQDTIRSMKRRVDGTMRDLIREGMEDGSIAASDPMLTAFTLAGALNWPSRWHRPDGPMPASEIAEKMVDLLTAGLNPR